MDQTNETGYKKRESDVTMSFSPLSLSVPGFVRIKDNPGYPAKAPFDPPEFYPELAFNRHRDETNRVYAAVREAFGKIGLDQKNYGNPHWRPLRDLAKPGSTVLIKPNLITHLHYLGERALQSTIVHGSVLRPIIDYLFLEMGTQGTIVIADNPIVATDFQAVMDATGISEMVKTLRDRGYCEIRVVDLRPRVLREAKNGDFIYENQAGDLLGYREIDLGSDSLFGEFDRHTQISYRTLADPTVDHTDIHSTEKSETDQFHRPGVHKYVISGSALKADVIINVAKMKTHCKAGVTLTLKNLVGTVYGKACIPHCRIGLPPIGDSAPSHPPRHYVAAIKLYTLLRRSIHIHRWPGFRQIRNSFRKKKILFGQYKHLEHGNWRGNDTIWRTILDLNRIAIYADKNGVMRDAPQRKMLCLIDGIIGQQGEGPMAGEPVATGMVFSGGNPVLTDALALRIMGIDWQSIPQIARARGIKRWPLLPSEPVDLSFSHINAPQLNFRLPKGWT
jgi:uncharacterized protein (DUF362 family)